MSETQGEHTFLPAGAQLFEYRIQKVLGHGGFGVTYLARDAHLDKTVAIKEYLPAHLAVRSDTHVSVRSSAEQPAFEWGLRQFLKEAQVLARFAHPNLVPVHRYFQAHGTAYFVMSYVEGETLGHRLKRCPNPPEDWLRRVLLPVLDGLQVVHRAGCLHRDIKPENILLTHDDVPVLIDFGAARVNVDSVTRSTLCALTAGYAPLEQYGDSGHQGPWTDLYALGAVAYRAVSGQKPPEAVNRIHADALVPAREAGRGRYSAEFLRAIDWALALHPDERPRTAPEWQRALGARGGATVVRTKVVAAERTRAQPPAAATPADLGAPWATASAPLAVMLAAGAMVFAWQNMRAAEPAIVAMPTMPAVVLDAPVAVAAKPARAAAVAAPAPAAAPAARRAPVARMEALSSFQDCPGCPSMTVLPPMEAAPLAVGRHEVTVAQYLECVADGACRSPLREARAGNLPVVNVSYGDAEAYAAWLSGRTGRQYRLPSEAEWEYAARAGTRGASFWGSDAQHCRYANAAEPVAGGAVPACRDGHAGLAAAGSFRPNWFDLHDTAGNAWEWTADCWRENRGGAERGCARRAARGGSWRTPARALRSELRTPVEVAHRSDTLGFRVVAQ